MKQKIDRKSKRSKLVSKEHPAKSFDEALDFIARLIDFPVGSKITYDEAAKAIEVSKRAKVFTYTLSAARQFGLVSTGYGSALIITNDGYRLLSAKGSKNARRMKMESVKKSNIYKELIEEFDNKPIPSEGILKDILISRYSIIPSAATNAAKKFLETINQVGANINGILCMNISDDMEEEKLNNACNENIIEVKTESKTCEILASKPDELCISVKRNQQQTIYMSFTDSRDIEQLFKTINSIINSNYKN